MEIKVTWASIALLFLLEIFIDKQFSAVGQGAEVEATWAS